MAQSKISKKTLQNRPIALLIFEKISNKTPLYINNKPIKLTFNPDIKGLDKLFKKNDVDNIIKADEFTLTKMFFVGKGGPYKLTDLDKTIEFGSNKGGDGGGIGATATTESLQCYYNALRYKLGKELSDKNAQESDITDKSLENVVHVFNGSKKLNAAQLIANHLKGNAETVKTYGTWINFDDKGQNVYTKTANALATNQKWPSFTHFHRGSPFMKACYEAKKLALDFDKTLKADVRKAPAAGYSDDKWNPGDIWMSTLKPDPNSSHPFDFGKGGESCNLTFEALKDAVYEKAIDEEVLGVSLKKATGTPKVLQFNIPKGADGKSRRIQNVDVDLKGFRFGKTGDFFSSTDVYLIFSNDKEMQFRSFDGTKSWQGEVKGAAAAGGKIGGGGVNFYCSDILKSPIGGKIDDAMKWTETKFDNSKFNKFYELYETYSVHENNKKSINKKELVDKKTFIANANGYISRGKNASGSFKFSRFMGLLLLDAIYTKKDKNTRKKWATKVLRYAMSNIDISSYFIKIE